MKQEILAYPVILTEYNDDGHYYVVTSPNIPGMVTDGNTIAEALIHAEDAMATMLDGTNYPAVQDPKLWELKDNQLISWVTVNMTKWHSRYGKTVRRNITIPKGLNDWAKENKINVSKVATDALRELQESKIWLKKTLEIYAFAT